MADDPVFSLEPLFTSETEEAISTRWATWANEGQTVEQTDRWIDTRDGSWFDILGRGMRREAARIYDLIGTEFLASAFPQTAWGDALDRIGALVRVERRAATFAEVSLDFSGADGVVIPAGTRVGTALTSEDDPSPEFEVLTSGTISGGTVTLTARATEAGEQARVGPRAVTVVLTTLNGPVTVTNPAASLGGSDADSDVDLRSRILEAGRGAGAANKAYYRRLAREEPGVGDVAIIRAGRGAGTILVLLRSTTGDVVPDSVVASLQARLDPVPAEGEGASQIGARAIVEAARIEEVSVFIRAELRPGYEAGLAQDLVFRNVRDVIARIIPGGEVVIAQLLSAVMRVPAIFDAVVVVNGRTDNLPLPEFAFPQIVEINFVVEESLSAASGGAA